jgi:hypothetical protein
MLRPEVMWQVVRERNWPAPEIDAFASPHNNLLPLFWTEREDALQQGWLRDSPLWMNPPFYLLMAVLRKL